jgi:hypothetical protein
MLKAEGWYSSKTTRYYIEYRVRRLRGKGQPETPKRKTRIAEPCNSRRVNFSLEVRRLDALLHFQWR